MTTPRNASPSAPASAPARAHVPAPLSTPAARRFSRRTFLVSSATVAGGLLLGYRSRINGFETQAASLVARGEEQLLAGWVTIAPDDAVTVHVPHVDMGQGVQTALAMMLAEELDADWAKVRAVQAPAEQAFANAFLAQGWVMQGLAVPSAFDGALLDGALRAVFAEAARFIDLQQTGGSTAVRLTGQVGMRLVGASARAMLVEAAARRWGVSAKELTTRDSVVTHASSARRARYGELARDAALLTAWRAPSRPALKPPSAYRLVGTSVPRLDIPKKVTGEQIYTVDLMLPDMLHAAVRAAPVHGGRLERVDPAPALAIAGVERVVSLPEAVAVVASGYWPARQGLLALRPVFSDGGQGELTTESIEQAQLHALETSEGVTRHARGDVDAALAASPAARVVEATYHVPFLHHAPMEPPAAVARFADGQLTVWTGDQNPLAAKRFVSELAEMDPDRVTIVPMPIGGSFGRRGGAGRSGAGSGALAYLAQSVALAKHCAPRPVKLIWDREEDFAQGAYRPQLVSRLRGAIRADGRPIVWSQTFIDGVPSRVDSFEIPYQIPHQLIRAVKHHTHVRVGSWRSVNHTQHGFWSECFIDELAQAAGVDPFAYRHALLPEGSRHRRVLETAGERAGWRTPLAPGVGRGIALVESYGSIVAEVVEASFDAAGRPRVHRVVAAVDCGGVCHPDTAAQQVEGAIVMGLSAALGERITMAGGAVVQKNFPDYPLLTMAGTPRIEVAFVASGAAWGGLGEPALPPVAPALVNALSAAAGRRLRRLPLAGVDAGSRASRD